MVLTATLFTHADTPVQLPLPDGAVAVGVGEELVELVEVVAIVEVVEAVDVVGCGGEVVVVEVVLVVVVVVVVVVGVGGGVTGGGEPETGQMFPRTAVIHEEPT